MFKEIAPLTPQTSDRPSPHQINYLTVTPQTSNRHITSIKQRSPLIPTTKDRTSPPQPTIAPFNHKPTIALSFHKPTIATSLKNQTRLFSQTR
jgi:hypothetical protein